MTAAIQSGIARVWIFLVREGVTRMGVVIFALWLAYESFMWAAGYADKLLDKPTTEAAAIIGAVLVPVGWVVREVLIMWARTQDGARPLPTPQADPKPSPPAKPDWR